MQACRRQLRDITSVEWNDRVKALRELTRLIREERVHIALGSECCLSAARLCLWFAWPLFHLLLCDCVDLPFADCACFAQTTSPRSWMRCARA